MSDHLLRRRRLVVGDVVGPPRGRPRHRGKEHARDVVHVDAAEDLPRLHHPVRPPLAQRVVKAGQVFSRIHVDDLAAVLRTSMERVAPGRVYHVADDEPAPPQEVIAHAARLLGLPVPPEVPFAEAELSPMARSFYGESKRVANRRIKEELGVKLAWPDYRAGLAGLLAAGF